MNETRRPRYGRHAGRLRRASSRLVIQSDQFAETGTVTILLVSGTLVDAPLLRVTVEPTAANGLRKPSQIMVDKAMSMEREKVGAPFGRLEAETIVAVNRSLALFFGLG